MSSASSAQAFKERISYETLLLSHIDRCLRAATSGDVDVFGRCVNGLLYTLIPPIRKGVLARLRGDKHYLSLAKYLRREELTDEDLKNIEEVEPNITDFYKKQLECKREQKKKMKELELKRKIQYGNATEIARSVSESVHVLTMCEDPYGKGDLAYYHLTMITLRTIIDVLDEHGLLLRERELFRGEA